MAPMAGGITYGQEDGPVLLLGPLEGLLPPGIPVHRIVGMLQKVRALLIRKTICLTKGTTVQYVVSGW